ncbi:hypothetical protein D3C72_1106970 [compost metagenome]
MVRDAALLEGLGRQALGVFGQRARELVELGEHLAELHGGARRVVRGVAGVARAAGDGQDVLREALALRDDAPVGAGGVHHQADVGLLGELLDDRLARLGAGLFFGVEVERHLAVAVEVEVLEQLHRVEHLQAGGLVVAHARPVGAVLGIHPEGALGRVAFDEDGVGVGHEQEPLRAGALEARDQVRALGGLHALGLGAEGREPGVEPVGDRLGALQIARARVDVRQVLEVFDVAGVVGLGLGLEGRFGDRRGGSERGRRGEGGEGQGEGDGRAHASGTPWWRGGG